MANFAFQVTRAFQGDGQFAFQGATGTPTVIIDTHDDVRRDASFVADRLRKERLRHQVAASFDEVYALAPSVQAAVDEVVTEAREWFPEYRIALDLPLYLDTVRVMAEHEARLAIEADDEEVLMILRNRDG